MTGRSTAAEKRWMAYVATFRCVVCVRHGPIPGRQKKEVHHVAENSGVRSNWSVVPLCWEHHVGGAGLHGMGTKSFINLYRPPGDSEYGLLVWFLEDLATRLQDNVQ